MVKIDNKKETFVEIKQEIVTLEEVNIKEEVTENQYQDLKPIIDQDLKETQIEPEKLSIKTENLESQKNYKCEQCGKCFNQPGYLKIHGFVHKEQKTCQKPVNKCFICEVCDETFITIQDLNIHKKTQHYKCDFCDETFIAIQDLNVHKKRQHCHYCHKFFENLMSLIQHTNAEHSHKCDLCNKYFSSSGLKIHKRAFHAKSIQKSQSIRNENRNIKKQESKIKVDVVESETFCRNDPFVNKNIMEEIRSNIEIKDEPI